MKIIIYGTGEFSNKLLEKIKLKENIEVVAFAETEPKKEHFLQHKIMKGKEIVGVEFDYLVVATALHTYYEIVSYLAENNRNYSRFESRILSINKFELLTKNSDLFMPYRSVELRNGIRYISDSRDIDIAEMMFWTKENYSASLIDLFFDLTDKHYGKKARNGWFLDIGANIGTTAIYVLKRVNPKLNALCFEIGKENYDLLRVNCILNNVETKVECVHKGLSNKRSEGNYCYNPLNPGASSCIASKENDSQKVELITLDEYLIDVKPREIDYIWIDTEGFEAEIILGAKNLLLQKKIPLVMEFNPQIYLEKGIWNDFLDFMKEVYCGFIDCRKDSEYVYPIEKLQEYSNNMVSVEKRYTDLFFT